MDLPGWVGRYVALILRSDWDRCFLDNGLGFRFEVRGGVGGLPPLNFILVLKIELVCEIVFCPK